MKKLIILTLFTFLFVPICKASSWTDKLPFNKEIIIHREEKRYKWYKLERVNEQPKSIIEHNCEYFEIIENDFSSWSEEPVEEKEGRIIEVKEEIMETKYDYIFLEKFYTSELKIKELKILKKTGEEVSYVPIICSWCKENKNFTNLNDKNYDTTITVYSDSTIVLYIKDYFDEEIIIHLIYEKGYEVFGWTTTLKNKGVVLKSLKLDESELIRINGPLYNSYKFSLKSQWKINEEIIKKHYRYKDELINCFEYQKKYLNDYFHKVDSYIKDEQSEKSFYNYSLVKKENKTKEESKSFPVINKTNTLIDDKKLEIKDISINIPIKRKQREYSKIPVFISILGVILIFLVLICRKIGQNLKNSR